MERHEEIPAAPRHVDRAVSDSPEVLAPVRPGLTSIDLRADLAHSALVALRIGGFLLLAALLGGRFRDRDEQGRVPLVHELDLGKLCLLVALLILLCRWAYDLWFFVMHRRDAPPRRQRRDSSR
jgi:hypothetical protein